MTPPLFSPAQMSLLHLIEATAERAGVPVYIVGGVVRDLLRGHPIGEKDFDFMVVGDAASFARQCCEFTGGTVKEFPDFLTAKIVAPTAGAELSEIDFASSREEIYSRPGSLPIVSRGDLAADLARRDFTVNAMALPLRVLGTDDCAVEGLRPVIVDYHGGLADLDRGIVRVLHGGSFRDDPTRVFRGCRYVNRLGGRFEESTETALRAALLNGALQTVSGFRIVTELKKILAESDFVGTGALLERYNVWGALGFPPLALQGDLEMLQRFGLPLPRRFEVFARILFAQSGAAASQCFNALGFGKKQIKHLEFDTAATAHEVSSNHLTVAGLWYLLMRGVGEAESIRSLLRAHGEAI